MKFSWNEEKNARLKTERDLSFPQILEAIASGALLDIVADSAKYPDQQVLVVSIAGYPVVVPIKHVEGEEWEMKTAFHSRKLKRKYGL